MPKYYVDTSIGYSRAAGARLHNIIVPYCFQIEGRDHTEAIAKAHEECRHRARDLEGHDPSFFTLVERLKEVSATDYADEEMLLEWRDAYAEGDYIWHRRLADGRTKTLSPPERTKRTYVPISELSARGFKELPSDLEVAILDELDEGKGLSEETVHALDKFFKQPAGKAH